MRLSKWLPQQDILGHPRIKLFITQGGLLSTHEATFHGVPIVGLPVGSDQLLNMKRSVTAGVGLMISWEELTKEKLEESVQRVLNEPEFTANVKARSAVMRDQETTPLERAVFWIEYVIRHKGAGHLKSSMPELNFAQAHSFDVIGFLAFVLLLSLVIFFGSIYYCSKCIFGRIFGRKDASREKEKRV